MGRTFLQGQTVQWIPNNNPNVQWVPNNNADPEATRSNINDGNNSINISNNDNRNENNNDDDESTPKTKSWKKRIAIFLFVLVIIYAAIMLWLFVFKNNNDDEKQDSPISNLQDPTIAPSSAPSNNTTTSTTSAPSTVPSDIPTKPLIFQPPSKSNCEAIAKNETIAGREEMVAVQFELSLDVVLTDNDNMTEALVSMFVDSIQEKILPSLAGCSVIVDEFVEDWRFVIFDGFVTDGILPPDERCQDGALDTLNCHRMSIQLHLFLKGSVRFLYILALISAEHGNLANHLGLPQPFSIVMLQGATFLTSTVSPTTMPSLPPSDPLLFESPSESNCIAIANNETIAGREQMEASQFGLSLDVFLTDNNTMTEALVSVLLDSIQEKILPSLAGCSVIVDEFVEDWRFVIFDAFVTDGSVPPDERCQHEALDTLNCHRMSIELNLFLKGSVMAFYISSLISDEYGNFANHLGLPEPFSIVMLQGATFLTPTASPTTLP